MIETYIVVCFATKFYIAANLKGRKRMWQTLYIVLDPKQIKGHIATAAADDRVTNCRSFINTANEVKIIEAND